ncbi:MAG TPA: wax ester/triacylglycerol synthase family O-acyltransferase [Acidimicrobiales bacterium]|nr:wax ester/triacylglycerol synthase family O-acyltransferase [Acidimicrobiales bacterium]
MSGIDPMFIYSETAASPMEVAYACVFDPATAHAGYSFEAVRDHLTRRLPGLAPFRRRLMSVPMGLDHPRWVDDPDFDLDNHLHRDGLPSPGEEAGLQDLAADIMGRKLDPDIPPWEMHIVEGLRDGKIGVISKVHHAVIDGVSGSAILAQLLDPTPEADPARDQEDVWQPAPAPSRVRLVTEALPDLLSNPVRMVRAGQEVGRTALRVARHVASRGTSALSIPLGAPAQFAAPLGAGRRVSFAHLNLEDVLTLRDYADVTVNDVVLAVCSGALRTYLAEHGRETASPLVAVVPVSVREHSERHAMGNRLSAMFVPLASDQERPLDRLRTIALTSKSTKAQERAVGYSTLAAAVAQAFPPVLARPALRLGAQIGAVRRLRPGNLVISNVPGPKFPLFFAGMRMLSVYPLGPVIDGVALNITVQSYVDSLFVGLNACPKVVPDTDSLARLVEEELTILTKAAQNDSQLSHAREAGSVLTGPPPEVRPLSLRVPESTTEQDAFLCGPRALAFGVPCLQ